MFGAVVPEISCDTYIRRAECPPKAGLPVMFNLYSKFYWNTDNIHRLHKEPLDKNIELLLISTNRHFPCCMIQTF